MQVGPELVRHLKVELGPKTCQPRPWRHNLTESDPSAAPIPDQVCGDLTAAAPGTKMVGDITYIPTWEGWVYLATVIDCYSKKVIGHAMDDHYRTPLISKAINCVSRNHPFVGKRPYSTPIGVAATRQPSFRHGRRPGGSPLGGSDRGVLGQRNDRIVLGCLEERARSRTVYPTRAHAIRDGAEWIDGRYNSRKLHSGIDYRTPSEVHNAYRNAQSAA